MAVTALNDLKIKPRSLVKSSYYKINIQLLFNFFKYIWDSVFTFFDLKSFIILLKIGTQFNSIQKDLNEL